MTFATKVLTGLLEDLAEASEDETGLTRTFLSQAMEEANAMVGEWMEFAGLTTRIDGAGNLTGRREGTAANAKTLLLGSHLDTVRNAGKYDGALGVLLPIVILARLRDQRVELPFSVEVIGFSEEEGVRFGSAYLGSAAYAGCLKESVLELQDADGITVREAMERKNGRLFPLPSPAHRKEELLGYIEVHIEQGPVLESEDLSVGVVTAIAGQSRFQLTWTGRAGHAGTTPMHLRRDALTGAAEFILAVERLARETPGLVATAGVITVSSGSANTVPGEVMHTLDVRHAEDAVRKEALTQMKALTAGISKARNLKCQWKRTQDDAAVKCDAALTSALAASVEAVQGRSLALVSGAGHDAVVMSTLTPAGMLFVRCRGGLSHHPQEYAAPRDLDVAGDVLTHFLKTLAASYPA